MSVNYTFREYYDVARKLFIESSFKTASNDSVALSILNCTLLHAVSLVLCDDHISREIRVNNENSSVETLKGTNVAQPRDI